jgi:general secretion pathway protein I
VATIRNHGAPRGGFTLLEVLIALVIASLALSVMFAAAVGGLGSSKLAASYDEATVRAQSHLAMVTDGGALRPGDWDGDDGGGYRWHVHIAPAPQGTPRPAAPLVLYDVSVWVTWQEGEHARQVRLDSQQVGQSPPLARSGGG